MTRFLPLVIGLTLALGACNPGSRQVAVSVPRYASLDATFDGAAVRERRATSVAVLPAWIGRPIRLREREDADSFEQVVSLNLAPRGETRENLVMIAMPRSRDAADRLLDGTARFMGKPTEAGIRAEIEAAFPGVAMQVVTRPASNAYGPYGLAVGRGPRGARCLYAWQWLDEAPALNASQSGGNPVSIRVRLCRSDITLEAMAASVNQMKLVPRFQDAAAEPVRVRRIDRVRARPSRLSAAAHRDAVKAAPPLFRAQASAPEETAPDGRRYLGGDTSPVPNAPAAALPSAPVRFADSRMTAQGTLLGPGGVAPASVRSPISADLPPEAYRGPASVSTR